MCQRAGLSFRGTLAGWRNELTGTSWKFSKGKYQVLPPASGQAGADWLGSSCAARDLGILVDNNLDRSEQCALAAENQLHVGLYEQRWVNPGLERWWGLLGNVQNSAGRGPEQSDPAGLILSEGLAQRPLEVLPT